MSPLERLINESIPTGTYGEADHHPWTPAEQLQHRLDLEEALDGWHWADDPRRVRARAA
ncbi:hypothetical protein [Streptomyces sp. NPDC001274]